MVSKENLNLTIPRLMITIIIICMLIFQQAFSQTIDQNSDKPKREIKDNVIPWLIIVTPVMVIEELNDEI